MKHKMAPRCSQHRCERELHQHTSKTNVFQTNVNTDVSLTLWERTTPAHLKKKCLLSKQRELHQHTEPYQHTPNKCLSETFQNKEGFRNLWHIWDMELNPVWNIHIWSLHTYCCGGGGMLGEIYTPPPFLQPCIDILLACKCLHWGIIAGPILML